MGYISASKLAADVAAGIGNMPGQIKYAGVTISASVSPIADADNLDPEGILNESDCEVVALRSAFVNTGIPATRATVQARQTESDEWTSFYVEGRTFDVSSVTLRLRRMA